MNRISDSDKLEVSVIIPMYGVEKYIERCARSLMEQSLTTGVEFLFINDASNDKSVSVLEKVLLDYPSRIAATQIITHETNKGLPSARNTGLERARGEYVVHIDGDDFPEPEMLEALLTEAKRSDADFVWCDYFLAYPDKKRIIRQPSFTNPIDAVKGMLRGSMKYNVWNKMCKRSLYLDNGITFPDGYSMGEDLTMIMVALHSKKCAALNLPLYNYVQSPNQMTAIYDEKKYQSLLFNCDRVWNYIEKEYPQLCLNSEYAALCQLMKWPFLLDGKRSSFNRWRKWFPESNKYIWRTKGVNKRIKFVEWCASLNLWPIVWLHYCIVIKLYYGIVYGK